MLGKIEGIRRMGQQRVRWSDSITNSMHMNLSKLWQIVETRSLVCHSLWGHIESDITQKLNTINNNISLQISTFSLSAQLSWSSRLLPFLQYCKQCCYEQWGACILSNFGFLWCSIAGSYSSSIFSVLRKFHTILHTG